MKKLPLLTAIVGIVLAGCSSSDEPRGAPRETETQKSFIRTESEAIDLAVALMEGRAGSRASYSIEDVDIFSSNSSRANEDTLIYAVNFADDKGFVLVSAAKTGEDIIGYADKGRIETDNIDPVSGFAFYMDAAKDYVTGEINDAGPNFGLDTTIVPVKPVIPPVVTYEKVAPRVTVEWGQRHPEGCLFENHVCGCTQTACLQIMSAFKEPTYINYTYPEHELESEYFDWNGLCVHQKSGLCCSATNSYYNCAATDESHSKISRLARELGHRSKAVQKFDPNATSTIGRNARNTMWELLLPSDIEVTQMSDFSSYDNHFTLLKDKKAVFYMRGDNGSSGHAWVCSGGERITTKHMDDMYIHENKTEIKIFFHFNWGWNGEDNGYFSAGVFDTSKSTTPSRTVFSQNVQFFAVFSKNLN